MKNQKYLDWLKQTICLVCHAPNPEPHHIPKDGHGAMGMKTDDMRSIPLCHRHHMEYHSTGKHSFAAKYGIDYEDCIERLNKIWRNRG